MRAAVGAVLGGADGRKDCPVFCETVCVDETRDEVGMNGGEGMSEMKKEAGGMGMRKESAAGAALVSSRTSSSSTSIAPNLTMGIASSLSTPPPSSTTLVVVLGGAALSELAALRALGRRDGVHYVFAVTGLLTSERMVGAAISA